MIIAYLDESIVNFILKDCYKLRSLCNSAVGHLKSYGAAQWNFSLWQQWFLGGNWKRKKNQCVILLVVLVCFHIC